MTFSDLELAEPILAALKEENYEIPTPIQKESIPFILKGKDIIGCAQTGSGKTAAFALPVLDHLLRQKVELGVGECRVVVLTPTRELANQVSSSFAKYGMNVDFEADTFVGGVSIGGQIRRLKGGIDVVVATPGRLIDLFENRKIRFNKVDHLILDEVDRMFDMGFIQDVKKIIRNIPTNRQTLCFSATMSESVDRLIQSITMEAVRITVDSQTKSADQVETYVCFLRNQDKADAAAHFISEEAKRDEQSKTLIFTATKQGADHLLKRLREAGIRCDALHGDKQQRIREKVLKNFREGNTQVLVATDVAARGLDIKGIDLVVNYDVPKDGDTYVHRVGRTGRAGKTGRAFSFCAEFDQPVFSAIEQFAGKSISVNRDHPYHFSALEEKYQSLFSLGLNKTSVASPISGARRSNRRNRGTRRN